MLDWKQLVHLSDDELARHDIAAVNLACANGLPGSELIDHDRCIRTIDEMATWVRALTTRSAFERRPKYWENSFGKFRIHALFSVLERSFGVRYNPAKVSPEVPLELDDLFIHGLIQGAGGTCGTLPVLYAAVGRRLGYPIKIVSARGAGRDGHLFARWDEPNGERFNIEATNNLDFYPDDNYRRGQYKSRSDWEATGSILKSMTPREELAGFIAQRGAIWANRGDRRQEVETLAWASAVAPHNVFYREVLKRMLHEWNGQLEKRKPPGFPNLHLTIWERHYPPGLPAEIERDVIGLTATQFLLDDPANERDWWTPLRRGVQLPQRLDTIAVNCRPNGFGVRMICSQPQHVLQAHW